ncbi:MAG: SpoVA/SpoVAEb family sporulation membrane protein [Clostridia bacterium]|nr:SpoVA/SpoVAEb family sporulation membrane protein [Clostridia bacterium]
MKLTKEQYSEIYRRHTNKSNLVKDCLWAFFVGGTICLIGEFFRNFYLSRGLSEQSASTAVPVTMVFLGVALTALRVYHKIANKAGAGTLVPITGFANAVSSASVEFKAEGIILGTCVKMFTIAGPVIACGTSASIVYGLVLLLLD